MPSTVASGRVSTTTAPPSSGQRQHAVGAREGVGNPRRRRGDGSRFARNRRHGAVDGEPAASRGVGRGRAGAAGDRRRRRCRSGGRRCSDPSRAARRARPAAVARRARAWAAARSAGPSTARRQLHLRPRRVVPEHARFRRASAAARPAGSRSAPASASPRRARRARRSAGGTPSGWSSRAAGCRSGTARRGTGCRRPAAPSRSPSTYSSWMRPPSTTIWPSSTITERLERALVGDDPGGIGLAVDARDLLVDLRGARCRPR